MTIDERLDKLATLPLDWNGRGASPPGGTAFRLAREAAKHFTMPIRHVDPSTDGGICLSLREGRRYADIELFNDGDVLTTTVIDGESPVVETWSEHAMSFAVAKIEEFIRNQP